MLKLNYENVDLLCYWINEREEVRKAKEAGCPREWSEDPIFQQYHFCNVHREDDRGTKELHALCRELNVTCPLLPEFYTAARLFNMPASTRVYWTQGVDALKCYRDQGSKIFHVAYVVSTCGQRMDKIDYVNRVVRDVRNLFVPRNTCRAAFDALRTVDGLGSFLAGQVVADLKNDQYLEGCHDCRSFAVMGPGSKKGMDFLIADGETPTTERNFHSRLLYLDHVIGGQVTPMDAQDLQNCLCEFSKFMRYKLDLPGRRRPY